VPRLSRPAALLWLLATAAPPAAAQIPPLERPALPEYLQPAPRTPFVLPPAPAAPERRPGEPLQIVVTRFRVTGATVFAAAELEALLARFTGRPIGSDELEEARLAVTAHYLAAGYVNSGAVLPDQPATGGTIEIRVIEGRLAEIVVGGRNGFRPGFIRERMALAAGPPLNVLRLQERMQVLLQNPQIERVNAELAPGREPGEAVLRLDVTEAPQQSAGFSVSNSRSPTIGATFAEGMVAWRNKLGLGETFGLRFGATEGMEDLNADLAVPVTARDTLLTLKYERSDASVVEAPFNLIDIRNRWRAVEAGLSHPVLRSPSRDLVVGVTLANRENTSFLLGEPFAFIAGQNGGRSTVSALRLSADWSERSDNQVLAARLTLSHGLDWFGATVSPGFPDSRFDSRLAQLQWARRLGAQQGQVLVRADWQRANGSLLPSEKFTVGGIQSVRGYRENALVRDDGWVVSAEYRRPVGRLGLAALGAGPDDGQLEIALFTDAGKARDDGGTSKRLSSVGLGLRWTPAAGVLAQLYKGFALQKIEVPTRTLADRGIYFLLAVQTQF
jgi:hemolysin activation/secretion protein